MGLETNVQSQGVHIQDDQEMKPRKDILIL